MAHIAPSARSEMSAAWRIRKAQQDAGIEAYALVHQGAKNSHVRFFNEGNGFSKMKSQWIAKLDSLPIRTCSKRQTELPWSAGWAGLKVSKQINLQAPDIINLHWATSGWFSLQDLSLVKCPIVFTCHDVWPVTAGCHCNLGCEGWRSECENCPQLGLAWFGMDVAHRLWRRKQKSYSKMEKLVMVTPSRWLGEMAKQSALFSQRRIEVIPNCLDMELFQPMEKTLAKKSLGLPLDKKTILFGAVNAIRTPYKGFNLLMEAVEILKQKNRLNEFHLVIFGESEAPKNMPAPATFLGNLTHEKEIARVYQAADIFVTPSQQDNFPSTVLEAISSGVPTVAFHVGGIPEMVKHKEHGYIAKAFDVKDFAEGIEWVSDSDERLRKLSLNARNFALSSFSPKVVSKRYIELYSELISEGKKV
ncbi:MAG: glycosyltransferase [Deltaproteobacteria bacterium]